jgi:L-threonylcarbamoyladenylate synthase
MKSIRTDRPDAPNAVRASLAGDGVVILPTDTLYGFSALISSEKGLERIGALKGTGSGRHYIYLANSAEMVDRYISSWGCGSRARLSGIWPAPLTGIFPSGGQSPVWVGETIAFRVPALDFLRDVVDAAGEPIASTSVNASGEPPLRRIADIEERFGESVELVVVGSPTLDAAASTVVDFTGAAPRVLREGSYDWMGGVNPSN